MLKSHSERRRVAHGARQMYDLVADIERYPEFLPWCAAVRTRASRNDGPRMIVDSDMSVSFKVFRVSFASRATLSPADLRIDTENVGGPFRRMRSCWKFADAEAPFPSCDVEFSVEFEFRSATLQKVAGLAFNEAMRQIVRAFERRALELYGGPPA